MSLKGFLKGAAEVAGGAVKLAGPAVAGTLAGGPAGGVLALSGQVAAGLEKRRSKRRETALGAAGPPVHKITAPTASLGIPAGLAALAASFGLDLDAGGIGVICAGGELSAAGKGLLMGIIALLSHLLGHGLQDSVRRR